MWEHGRDGDGPEMCTYIHTYTTYIYMMGHNRTYRHADAPNTGKGPWSSLSSYPHLALNDYGVWMQVRTSLRQGLRSYGVVASNLVLVGEGGGGPREKGGHQTMRMGVLGEEQVDIGGPLPQPECSSVCLPYPLLCWPLWPTGWQAEGP